MRHRDPIRFDLTEEPILPSKRSRAMADASAGALVCFEGWVRDHHRGRTVVSLAYEAYPELAKTEGRAVVSEAADRFDVHRIHAVHRTGPLAVGDVAVWVGVAAAHRDAAFEACRYVIDQLKQRVPIWKKERYDDGDSTWINSDHDEDPEGV